MAKYTTNACGATFCPNFQVIQVVPPGGQIFNWCKWCHLVADMVVYIVVDMDVDKVADMVVKIPNDYYWCDWRLVILKEMVIGVVNVDVDKTLCEMNEN